MIEHFRHFNRLATAIFVLFGLAAGPVAAGNDDALESSTIWRCWYNNDTRILCRLLKAADEDERGPDRAEARSAASVPQPPATSQYPRRGPLPPIVGAILERPASLRERTISIPLFTTPEDMAFAEELAEAVMCGVRRTCKVEFERSAVVMAMLGGAVATGE